MDADLVVVCELIMKAGMHSYPYQTRCSPLFQQQAKLRMADVLQTMMMWSCALVQSV